MFYFTQVCAVIVIDEHFKPLELTGYPVVISFCSLNDRARLIKRSSKGVHVQLKYLTGQFTKIAPTFATQLDVTVTKKLRWNLQPLMRTVFQFRKGFSLAKIKMEHFFSVVMPIATK